MHATPLRGRLVRIAAIATGIGLLLTGCSAPGAATGNSSTARPANPTGPVTIRFSSYGDPTKLKIRSDLLATYTKDNKDGVTVTFEGTPSADYWDKLATQFAGNNAPDVINIDAARIAQYGGKGALQPLDPYVGKELDASGIDKNLLAQGALDGKQYGVPIAMSMTTVGYDTTVFTQLGIPVPKDGWTWDDFAKTADEIWDKSGHKIHGTEDLSGDLGSFELWLRSRGGQIWKDGKLAFSDKDLTAWWQYWADLRKSGGTVTADVAAQYKYGDWPHSPLATKVAAMARISTPNLAGGFRALTDHQIDIVLMPADKAGGKSGSFAAPSSLLAINTKAASKSASAKVISWFVNSKEAALGLGLISGPPASSKALDALLASPDLKQTDKDIITFTQTSLPKLDEGPEPAPAANTPVADLFLKISQDVGFGRTDVKTGVADFLSQADQTIKNG